MASLVELLGMAIMITVTVLMAQRQRKHLTWNYDQATRRKRWGIIGMVAYVPIMIVAAGVTRGEAGIGVALLVIAFYGCVYLTALAVFRRHDLTKQYVTAAEAKGSQDNPYASITNEELAALCKNLNFEDMDQCKAVLREVSRREYFGQLKGFTRSK